jgi:hypothetical protein
MWRDIFRADEGARRCYLAHCHALFCAIKTRRETRRDTSKCGESGDPASQCDEPRESAKQSCQNQEQRTELVQLASALRALHDAGCLAAKVLVEIADFCLQHPDETEDPLKALHALWNARTAPHIGPRIRAQPREIAQSWAENLRRSASLEEWRLQISGTMLQRLQRWTVEAPHNAAQAALLTRAGIRREAAEVVCRELLDRLVEQQPETMECPMECPMECLVILFGTWGRTLPRGLADEILRVAEAPHPDLPARVKFKYMDFVDLGKSGWKPRRPLYKTT